MRKGENLEISDFINHLKKLEKEQVNSKKVNDSKK